MRKRVRALISGQVQGVFFRGTAAREARRWGVTGFVRNLPDGRVEVVSEGDSEKLERLVAWCRQGPPSARVEGMDTEWSDFQGQFTGFDIR